MGAEGSTAAPTLSDAERAGMKDFFLGYVGAKEEIDRELMAICMRIPRLAELVGRMSPEQLAEQDAVSMDVLRRATVDGDWTPLLAQQRQQGSTYAAMGIDFADWFEIVGGFQAVLIPRLSERLAAEPVRFTAALVAMGRYLSVAMGIIGDEYIRTKERIITQQADAIQELSTPVLQVRDRLLLVPLIGMLDTHRARTLTESLLHAIRAHRAKVVVMDITGVAAVDSRVANHLLQTVAAARLMGARTVITGLSSDVAQALVTLGVDVDRLNTVGDLQGGMEEAERLLGLHVAPLVHVAGSSASARA